MIIGIDGNCWYASNGLCLGDPRAHFTFERTLRETVEGYRAEFKSTDTLPGDLSKYWDMTPEEYRAATPAPVEGE